MNTMNIPGFTAEAALSMAGRNYRQIGNASVADSGVTAAYCKPTKPTTYGPCEHIISDEGDPCSRAYCGADRYPHREGCACPPPSKEPEHPPTLDCSQCVCVKG